MIYSKNPCYGDGQWHCPFSEEWVRTMKRAAFRCKFLTKEQIESTLIRDVYQYRVPTGDFLEEEQDVRGLPLSWCKEEEMRFMNHPTSCTTIYDYDTIPDVVVTNGMVEYEYKTRNQVLTA